MYNCVFKFQFVDRENPIDKHIEVVMNKYGLAAAPISPQFFGSAGKEHMEKYGIVDYNIVICFSFSCNIW